VPGGFRLWNENPVSAAERGKAEGQDLQAISRGTWR